MALDLSLKIGLQERVRMALDGHRLTGERDDPWVELGPRSARDQEAGIGLEALVTDVDHRQALRAEVGQQGGCALGRGVRPDERHPPAREVVALDVDQDQY